MNYHDNAPILRVDPHIVTNRELSHELRERKRRLSTSRQDYIDNYNDLCSYAEQVKSKFKKERKERLMIHQISDKITEHLKTFMHHVIVVSGKLTYDEVNTLGELYEEKTELEPLLEAQIIGDYHAAASWVKDYIYQKKISNET